MKYNYNRQKVIIFLLEVGLHAKVCIMTLGAVMVMMLW